MLYVRFKGIQWPVPGNKVIKQNSLFLLQLSMQP